LTERRLTYLSAETKGFGPSKPEPRAKSSKQIQREQGAAKYDEISQKGGQEYNVFVRQFGADAKSWLPCGSVAVPRNAQVADAIYANEKGLKEVCMSKDFCIFINSLFEYHILMSPP
jgi:hypothetical protein